MKQQINFAEDPTGRKVYIAFRGEYFEGCTLGYGDTHEAAEADLRSNERILGVPFDSDILYSLRPMEVVRKNAITVVRVPGGWIFDVGQSSVFVPFNNEFQTA